MLIEKLRKIIAKNIGLGSNEITMVIFDGVNPYY